MTDLNVIPTIEHSQPTATMPTCAHAGSTLGRTIAVSEVTHLLTTERDVESPVTT